MLQPLRKNSKKKILLKLKLKDFFKYQLPQHVLVFGTLLLCAWLFNRWIESIMLCVAHTCVRNAFNKQFHFGSSKTVFCTILTLSLIWFVIPVTLPLGVSLLSSVFIAFIIGFFGFVAQDRVDYMLRVKALEKHNKELLEKISHKDIYAMSEDELYEYCRAQGLSDADCKIAYFIVYERLKGKELYDAIGYSERQTKRKRTEILNKIK